MSQFLSNKVQMNMNAPQGCVLSPALFTLYILDCQCDKESALQVKFSDDMSLTGMMIGDESTNRTAVKDMVSWCNNNFRCLNVSMMKEMVTDFWKNAPAYDPLIIKGENVKLVHQYKYFGTTPDDKLDWTKNSSTVLKKAKQWLFFLKKLKSFRVNSQED